MKIKYILIILSLVLDCSSGAIYARQRSKKELKTTTVSSVITDETGKPVAGARIFGNDGAVRTTSDASGKFILVITPGSEILVEADGFISHVFDASTSNSQTFVIYSTDPVFGKNNIVNVAYNKMPKGELTGAVSMLNPETITPYDNIQGVTEIINGRVPGMLGSSNIRGIGTPVFVVDGLPRDLAFLDVSEVEDITILKDVNAAILYGAQALNGVVMITTKRGTPFKKQINVSAHYGLSFPRALPKYLSSADYMENYNIALQNDGKAIRYDDATIENFRSGNPYRYPSTDYFSNEYLKSFKPFSKIIVDLSGGNKNATYYSNLSWDNQGNLINFGDAKRMSVNNFKARGNVDLQITDRIKTSIDAVGFIGNNRQPWISTGNYWSQASTLRPDLFTPLLPISMIDPELKLLTGRKRDISGLYLAGGNSSYQQNPITDIYLGGNITQITRNFSVNNRVDADLSNFVPGLGFHTNISFDFLNFYQQYVQNKYAVYQPTWNEQDRIISLTKFGEDNRTGNQNVGSAYGQRRFGFYAMFDYEHTWNKIHHLSGNLLGYGSNIKYNYDVQAQRYTNLGLRLKYDFAHKYLIDFSSAVVSSAKLHPDNRIGFSPSLGLGWVISSEGFMSPVSAINFLKLKLSAGIMNTDNFDYFLYDEPYTNSGSLYWYEGTSGRNGVIPIRGANKNLFYEKRKDINIGMEGMMFNRKLSFDAFYFNNIHDGIVIQPKNAYPSYFINSNNNGYIPYANFNKNAYRGFELGLSWQQKISDFSFMIGGNILYATSERLAVDEIYQNDYQYRKGHPVDARFGLVSEGFFMNRDEINSHAYQSFGAVVPGDIKYVDQNKDGIIDTNDEIYIGRWQHPFSYGVQVKLSFKRLTLFARGTGRTGADGYLSNPYYWAQGDVKYSEYMLNHWTEATKNTATYPRLSSTTNNNNFRSSTFWLYKDNYFNLERVQLTWDVPVMQANKLSMKELSVFVNASNFLTVSPVKDIRLLNIGSEPQYRSFSIGIKTLF